jgi:hypothetical protein
MPQDRKTPSLRDASTGQDGDTRPGNKPTPSPAPKFDGPKIGGAKPLKPSRAVVEASSKDPMRTSDNYTLERYIKKT